jgi:hypothetical protein
MTTCLSLGHGAGWRGGSPVVAELSPLSPTAWLVWTGDGILPRMPTLPLGTLLVRTDFTDDDAWDQVRDEATGEYGPDGFCAYVEPVSDPRWAGATWELVKAATPADDAGPCVLFVADSVTFTSPEHPILVIDLGDKILSVAEFPEVADRTPFRCIPPALWEVENNLSIANLGWEDFADTVDDDGVYRGMGLAPLTPEEKAAAERQAQLEEQRQLERLGLELELQYWGGRLPGDRVRAATGNARAMARLDVGLAEAIAAASPDIQRSIARWAARRAYEVAGIADLDWVVPALRALDQGQRLPPPFDERTRVWQRLRSDSRVPHGTVPSLRPEGPPNMSQPHMAVPAMFAAAGPDPLDAALGALYDAAVAFGRDDYPALVEEVRRAFRL